MAESSKQGPAETTHRTALKSPRIINTGIIYEKQQKPKVREPLSEPHKKRRILFKFLGEIIIEEFLPL